MNSQLGIFLKEKIKKHIEVNNIKKADIIRQLNISTQYLNDIENGKRVPSPELMKKLKFVLNLSELEQIKMYDLASYEHKVKKIPADIEKFIIENDNAKDEIRNLMKKYENKR